jgi:hypothetical protein
MNRFSWRSVPWMYSILGWVMLFPLYITLNSPEWLDVQSWLPDIIWGGAAAVSFCALAVFTMIGIFGGIHNINRPGFRIKGIISVGIVLPLWAWFGGLLWLMGEM